MKLFLLNLYWVTTRLYLRLRGAEIGRNVKCNGFPYVRIRKGGRMVIGDDVQINAAPWANAHVVKGSSNFYVAEGAILRIGNGVGISGSRIVAMQMIEIDNGSLIGAGCLICDSDMHEIPLGSERPTRTAPIRIGCRAFLGASSIVLKGVEIGDGSVIAAGSVVAKSVVNYALAAGNPAQEIRTYRALNTANSAPICTSQKSDQHDVS